MAYDDLYAIQGLQAWQEAVAVQRVPTDPEEPLQLPASPAHQGGDPHAG